MVCKQSWQELDNPRHRPSRHAAFGEILNQTTPDTVFPTMRNPEKVNTANQSVFLGTKPKRTVACNQPSNYSKTLKGEYSAEISFPFVRTLNGRWYAISPPLC